MNILFISPYVPYKKANHAGGVVMAHDVEELRKNNNVFILCFEQNDQYDKDDRRELIHISIIEKCVSAITHLNMPLLFSIRKSKHFQQAVLTAIEEQSIDAVHIEYTQMGQYAKIIKAKYPHVKVSIVLHDVCVQIYDRMVEKYSGILKLFLQRQRDKVEKCEKEYISCCDNVITLSDKDKQLVNKYYSRDDAEFITPFFGLSGYRVYDGRDICFLGKMDRPENYNAANRLIEIYKSIEATKPELYIIGANPPAMLSDKSSESIHVTGFVENTDEYMAKARLAVFPLDSGAGIKIKVLNAMSMGIPVITTNVGAEGIDPEGKTIVLAESNDDFVEKINHLYDDDVLLQEISKKEIELIESQFSWKKTQDVFQKIYRE